MRTYVEAPSNTDQSSVDARVVGATGGGAFLVLVIAIIVVVIRTRRARRVDPNGSRAVLTV